MYFVNSWTTISLTSYPLFVVRFSLACIISLHSYTSFSFSFWSIHEVPIKCSKLKINSVNYGCLKEVSNTYHMVSLKCHSFTKLWTRGIGHVSKSIHKVSLSDADTHFLCRIISTSSYMMLTVTKIHLQFLFMVLYLWKGSHAYNKGKALVVSKVPLPNYRADLDEQHGSTQKEVRKNAHPKSVRYL